MNKWFTRLGFALALFASTSAVQAQETLVVDGSKGYDGALVQGQDYRLPGTDGTWYAIADFFTHKEGDVWTFNAMQTPDYAYLITLDADLKYILVEHRATDDADAALADYDVNGAVWLSGGGNVGFPTPENSPGSSWNAEKSMSVPQISRGIYRLRFTAGQEFATGTNMNIKFFPDKTHGTEFNPLPVVEENEWIFSGEGADGYDAGNIYVKADKQALVSDGDVITLTLNMETRKITVDYQVYVPKDFPTFNGANMEKKGNTYIFEGALEQGKEFTLGNLDVIDVDAADLYVDQFAVQSLGGGKYKFNAISGNYTVALNPAQKFLRIFPGTFDAPATYADGKALWIIGSDGIGQPSAAVNPSNWGGNLNTSIPVAQVSENVYKIALTKGVELNGINFKFFGQAGWGMEFTHEDLTMEANDYLTLNAPECTVGYNNDGELTINHGGDDGNIFAGSTALGNNDKLILTIDLNGHEFPTIDETAMTVVSKPGKITVEFQGYEGPKPTLNGQNMTSDGDIYYGELNLKPGDTFQITDPNDVNLDEFFVDKFFADNKTGGTFAFTAVEGQYTILLNEAKKLVRIFRGTYAAPAGIAGGGLWIMGDGIGYPTVDDGPGWNTGKAVSIPVAQTEENIYKFATVGLKQTWGDWINFKFYGGYNWENEFRPDGETYAITTESDFVRFGDGTGGDSNDPGNLYLVDGANGFQDGVTYFWTIDFTKGLNAGVLTVSTEGEFPTAIQNVEVRNRQADNAIYTLSGVRVQNPTQHGIYIQNGKKIVR